MELIYREDILAKAKTIIDEFERPQSVVSVEDICAAKRATTSEAEVEKLRSELYEVRAERDWLRRELDMAEAKLEMVYLIFGKGDE